MDPEGTLLKCNLWLKAFLLRGNKVAPSTRRKKNEVEEALSIGGVHQRDVTGRSPLRFCCGPATEACRTVTGNVFPHYFTLNSRVFYEDIHVKVSFSTSSVPVNTSSCACSPLGGSDSEGRMKPLLGAVTISVCHSEAVR